MAGKGGGGAWKVAYADFVTAMMAFFLVMWITSQDQKFKEAVSHYFMDPMGFHPIGQSKNPGKAGAIFESATRGDVPQGKEVANGKGRASYTPGGEFSYATKLVGDVLASDAELQDHWNASAVKAMTKAQALPQREGDPHTPDEKAAFLLARQLADEAVASIPQEISGLHRELLMSAITEVNWQELAEDVIAGVSLPPPPAPRATAPSAASGLPVYR